MTDQRLAVERQRDDLEPRLEIARGLAKQAKRVIVCVELAGRGRRRVAADPAGIEALQEELGELLAAGARLGARISFRLVGEADPTPLLGPMIAVETGERVHDRRGILRADALERTEASGAAQHLGLDLVQGALACAGRARR